MIGRFSTRYRVVNVIRRHKQISRVEIASLTGLSRSAVTGLTHELLEEGLIEEKSEAGSKSERLLFQTKAVRWLESGKLFRTSKPVHSR